MSKKSGILYYTYRNSQCYKTIEASSEILPDKNIILNGITRELVLNRARRSKPRSNRGLIKRGGFDFTRSTRKPVSLRRTTTRKSWDYERRGANLRYVRSRSRLVASRPSFLEEEKERRNIERKGERILTRVVCVVTAFPWRMLSSTDTIHCCRPPTLFRRSAAWPTTLLFDEFPGETLGTTNEAGMNGIKSRIYRI